MNRRAAILLLLTALPARADGLAEKLAAAGIAEFTAAYQAWDGVGFGAAAELFRQASTNAPTSATHYYWLGAAQFHRMLQLRSLPPSRTNALAADKAMDAALDALNRAVKLDPRHDAESHALLGTLYGMKIDGNLVRAVRFGPRVDKYRKQALAGGPDNPRVRYLLGVCQFHTAKKPTALREALATLLAAEQLFAAEAKRPAQPLEPRWGGSSCLTFIGRTYELLGQRKEAADYFRKALATHPADHLAKEGLARVTPAKQEHHEPPAKR
jgi:tetratricopeptide (TPR) repeat protein